MHEFAQKLNSQPLALRRLEIIEAAVPQHEGFRSAIGVRNQRQAIYARWWDAEGSWGIGECSCRPDPHYSAEFNEGVKRLYERYLFDRLRRVETFGDLRGVLSSIRGWPFARAAVVDAALDCLRRRGDNDALDDVPKRTDEVAAGISLGIFETAEAAVAKVGESLARGYRRIKLKVHPSMDLAPVRAIRHEFAEAPLAFDANGSCGKSDLDDFLPALAGLDSLFVEQPFAPGRFDLDSDFKKRFPATQLCLDESIKGRGDLLVALRLGAIDQLNLKPGRVGGQLAAIDLITECERLEVPVWIGGMFETGVGRFANLRIASRLDPGHATVTGGHDLSPSSRYFPRDVVADPIEMTADGFVHLSEEADKTPVTLDDRALSDMTTDQILLQIDPLERDR